MEYLHTMIRVTDLKATIVFFELMGFVETRRIENDKGRFTLVFLAAPDDAEQAKASRKPTVELTYNWDPEDYKGGRNFGHLAYAVDDIYALCAKLQKAGVTINRPPRDGHMAFIRTPDAISIELIQKGEPKAPAEPWASTANIGVFSRPHARGAYADLSRRRRRVGEGVAGDSSRGAAAPCADRRAAPLRCLRMGSRPR